MRPWYLELFQHDRRIHVNSVDLLAEKDSKMVASNIIPRPCLAQGLRIGFTSHAQLCKNKNLHGYEIHRMKSIVRVCLQREVSCQQLRRCFFYIGNLRETMFETEGLFLVVKLFLQLSQYIDRAVVQSCIAHNKQTAFTPDKKPNNTYYYLPFNGKGYHGHIFLGQITLQQFCVFLRFRYSCDGKMMLIFTFSARGCCGARWS